MLKIIAGQRDVPVTELIVEGIDMLIESYEGVQLEKVKPYTIIRKVFRDVDYKAVNNTRKREYVSMRNTTMVLQYLFCDLTMAEIGETFNKAHSTVSLAISSVKGYVDTNDKYTKDLFDPVFEELHYQFRKTFKNRQVLSPPDLVDIYRVAERLDKCGFKKYRP